MKLSIITPTYNSGNFIKETLNSIHDQSYTDLEHLIFDGKSTDNTVEILKNYEGNIDWVSEPDKGQSDAINKGFSKVTGDIIAWQNADDTYEPDTFEYIMNYFENNPQVDLVYGSYHEIDEIGNILCTVKTKKWSLNKFKLGRFCPVQPTVFWRRSVVDELKGLNEDLHYCMDVDFYSRIIKNGYTAQGINKVLGSFRVHNESKTQNSENRLAHKKEYKNVLSHHFQYNLMDSCLFEFYYLRSQLAVRIKRFFGI